MNRSRSNTFSSPSPTLPESPRHVTLRDLSVAALTLEILQDHEELPADLYNMVGAALDRLTAATERLREAPA